MISVIQVSPSDHLRVFTSVAYEASRCMAHQGSALAVISVRLADKGEPQCMQKAASVECLRSGIRDWCASLWPCEAVLICESWRSSTLHNCRGTYLDRENPIRRQPRSFQIGQHKVLWAASDPLACRSLSRSKPRRNAAPKHPETGWREVSVTETRKSHIALEVRYFVVAMGQWHRSSDLWRSREIH